MVIADAAAPTADAAGGIEADDLRFDTGDGVAGEVGDAATELDTDDGLPAAVVAMLFSADDGLECAGVRGPGDGGAVDVDGATRTEGAAATGFDTRAGFPGEAGAVVTGFDAPDGLPGEADGAAGDVAGAVAAL